MTQHGQSIDDMNPDELRAEVQRLTRILNTPLYDDFLEAVKAEAAHQTYRWSSEHDDCKTPEEWHSLIDWLTSKAMSAQIRGDSNKALHHTISSAAALLHWHRTILESNPNQTP